MDDVDVKEHVLLEGGKEMLWKKYAVSRSMRTNPRSWEQKAES
jgi:hypothetical protein